jgi:hypothetical protein
MRTVPSSLVLARLYKYFVISSYPLVFNLRGRLVLHVDDPALVEIVFVPPVIGDFISEKLGNALRVLA